MSTSLYSGYSFANTTYHVAKVLKIRAFQLPRNSETRIYNRLKSNKAGENKSTRDTIKRFAGAQISIDRVVDYFEASITSSTVRNPVFGA